MELDSDSDIDTSDLDLDLGESTAEVAEPNDAALDLEAEDGEVDESELELNLDQIPDMDDELEADVAEEVVEEENPQEMTPAEYGKVQHREMREYIEANDSREQGPLTYTCEKVIRDADGNVAYLDGRRGQPDYIDYEKNVIYDIKPIHEGETEEDVRAEYQEQFERYEKLYEQARGQKPDIQLLTYPALEKGGDE